MTKKLYSMLSAFFALLSVLRGEEVRLEWVCPNGVNRQEWRSLIKEPGGFRLRIEKSELASSKAIALLVTPEFGFARKGEKGFWFSPYGYYGEFDRDNGVFIAEEERQNMPMYGWSTERGAYTAIFTSLAYYPHEYVSVKDGRYEISTVFESSLLQRPYEDVEIAYRAFPPLTNYATLAACYRDYQLSRGAVVPLRERVKGNLALKAAIEAPEIRIRQAWKPVPTPLRYQQPENEPSVHVAVTFDRVADIARSLKRAGVAEAELCLVGWNVGGHDGRWPQAFPSEPLLGGDTGLRDCVAAVRRCGYSIVPHGNFRDAYTIADCWDGEWLVKGAGGEIVPDRGGKYTWGGGVPHLICPQRAYERFASKDMPRMAAFGFRGMGYFDVVSILLAPECLDPRHACNPKESARYWGLCADISRREFGGFASEGAVDHFAGHIDSVLYASFDSPLEIARKYRDEGGLAKRHVPIFQIVYNGIIVSNPFTSTVNFTVQDRYWQLKLLEYGGRPNFYFYSKFLSAGKDWMGQHDLGCATDEELESAVAKIREGWDVWAVVRRLQYEYIVGHEQIAPDVFQTTWSDGTVLLFNYSASVVKGVRPMDWGPMEGKGGLR